MDGIGAARILPVSYLRWARSWSLTSAVFCWTLITFSVPLPFLRLRTGFPMSSAIVAAHADAVIAFGLAVAGSAALLLGCAPPKPSYRGALLTYLFVVQLTVWAWFFWPFVRLTWSGGA